MSSCWKRPWTIFVIFRPGPGEDHPQNLCLDAGYTGSGEKVRERGYTPHIRSRGEEKKELERDPDFHARRWVVEVTHSFFNRFHKLLVRFEKKPPIIWPWFNWPAPLLPGVDSSRFIVDFGIGSKLSADKKGHNDTAQIPPCH